MIDDNIKPRDIIEKDRLSEKACEFIEKRRGERSFIEYVNMVFDNLSDKTASSAVTDGVDLLAIIETMYVKLADPLVQHQCNEDDIAQARRGLSGPDAGNHTGASRTREITKIMAKSFPERIPFDLFYKKCLDSGITVQEIEAEVENNRCLFQITVNKTNDFVNILTILVYSYLKELYHDMSASHYYGICLENGLTVNDIRFAEMSCDVAVPVVALPKDTAAHPETANVERKLIAILHAVKREYPDKIPVSELLSRCARSGLTVEDVDKLQKLHTQQLLVIHNEHRLIKENNDNKAHVNAINEKINLILNDANLPSGMTISPEAFYNKCKSCSFNEEELVYAMKVLKDHNESADTFNDIKYMNNKAYLILSYLRTLYPGKIPYNIYYNRCRSMGLTKEEIADAFRQIGPQMFTEKGDDEYYLKVLDNIIGEYTRTRPKATPVSNAFGMMQTN